MPCPAAEPDQRLPSPSPSHHPNTFDYVDLGPGDCFDAPQFSAGLTKVVKKPCTGPHDAEVTGLTSLPPGLHGEGEMLAQALPLCRPVTQPVYDRLTMDKRVLTSAALYPDAAAYANGRRTLTCALGAADARSGKKLTAPLN
ncbi:septum formation family protein [Streptacidiphilus monticola]